MTFTNGTIPNQYDSQRRLLEDIRRLQFELEEAKKSISGLYSELENIPKAIEEHGYINLYIESEKRTIKLVEEKEEE